MITDERLRELAMIGLRVEIKQIHEESKELMAGISWTDDQKRAQNEINDQIEEEFARPLRSVADMVKPVTKQWDKAFDAQQKSDRSYMRTPAMRRRISLAMKRRWAERRGQ